MPDLDRRLSNWFVLIGVLGLVTGGRLSVAIADPSPRNVQVAIKNCILSLIVLDATCTVVVCPTWQGMVILALLVPSVALGRWVYST